VHSHRRVAQAPPTSDALIAAALETGDIDYETSLLYRAYALYDLPRCRMNTAAPSLT
jgi:hypothetical protein